MKRGVAILLCIALFFASCKPVHFDRPPETRLEEIPAQFHGNYYCHFPEKPKSNKLRTDSMLVNIDAKSIGLTQKNKRKALSDSMVFSKCGEDFYISVLSNKDGTWELYQLSKKNEDILIYPLALFGTQEEKSLELEKYFTSTVKKSVENIDGIVIYQMNEEKLTAYMEKNRDKFKLLTLYKVKQ